MSRADINLRTRRPPATGPRCLSRRPSTLPQNIRAPRNPTGHCRGRPQQPVAVACTSPPKPGTKASSPHRRRFPRTTAPPPHPTSTSPPPVLLGGFSAGRGATHGRGIRLREPLFPRGIPLAVPGSPELPPRCKISSAIRRPHRLFSL